MGCYASPREDVRRERLGRSRDRFPGPETLRSLAGRRRLAALGLYFLPPGTGAPRRSRLFRSFPLQRISPRYARRSQRGPKKAARPSTHSPPLFSGARTRGPIIEFARVDRMRAFVCRRGTADRNPTSPPTRRLSVLVLGGRRPQTGLRVLRRDRVDQRVWQSQTTRPLRF